MVECKTINITEFFATLKHHADSKREARMKGDIQAALDEILGGLPLEFLKRKIESKLAEAGIEPTSKRVNRVTDAIVAGEDNFTLDDETLTLDVSIAFSEDDIRELTDSIEEFCQTQLPEIISNSAKVGAQKICSSLRRDWPAQKAWQDGQMAQFKINLQLRWGEPFDQYRMLLTAAREVGEEYHLKHQRSRAKKNRHKRLALSRLHARACRVVDEILVLLKMGFADGAMARWRTLHEITTVSSLIAVHDDDLAERYLLHEIVEAKRALDTYEQTYLKLGFRPPSKRESARTRRAFNALRDRFGKEYCTPYGWAVRHLSTDGLRFSDLEEAAMRSQMRSYYKMASYNVHASTKGITDQLGLLDGAPVILTGPSNAGLEEPAQNAAVSLVQITALLFGPKWKFDDILMIQVLCNLRDKAVEGFIRASRKLKRDEYALRRVAEPDS